MQEKISIIVPVYNVKEYLDRCVQSIVEQTYQNIEIILVDDGSTDGSEKLCDLWAEKDSRIKVIHKTNGGLSDARNKGVSLASGNILAFVDSDDFINKDYISFLYKAMAESGADICECSYRHVHDYMSSSEQYKEPTVYSNREMLKLLAQKDFVKHVVAWNKLYKKALFSDISYPVGKLHEDEFTTYKLFYKAKKIAVINDCLYYYFYNKDSITTKKISDRRIDGIQALIERYYFYKNNGLNEILNKTARQLFQLFADFLSKDKSCFYDYKRFKKALKIKFKAAKKIFNKEKFGFAVRCWLVLASINISVLKKYNMMCYYWGRVKDIIHGRNKKSN